MAKEANAAAALRDIKAAERVGNADLILMQEVVSGTGGSVAEELARQMGRHVAFAPSAPGVTDQGLAILSRFPLTDVRVRKLKACDLRFRSRHRIGLEATAATPQGPILVINAHLDTRVNTPDRLAQLEPMIADASSFRGPKLIGGDFNTNDMYWIGNVCPLPRLGRHSESIVSFMHQHGFETPFARCGSTFPTLGLHLDWVFLNGLRHSSAGVSRIPFSDHHAIWTRFEIL
jgi:endonuclease/exonuclease/phosphatase family metal-dependent hydrolase